MPIFDRKHDSVGEAKSAIAELLPKYHQPLEHAGVKVDVIAAIAKTDKNGDPVGPALKLHGYPCLAVVRVVPYKLRVQGHGDAEITVDGDRWHELAPEEQVALIDHELEHIALVCEEKTGSVKRDDAGRPRLTMRLHDRQFGWFDSIARRHGPSSIEVKQAEALWSDELARQVFFPFHEPSAKERGGKERTTQKA